ncbi:hypothetical protein TKK_0002077 [Trichogramma kaykai]
MNKDRELVFSARADPSNGINGQGCIMQFVHDIDPIELFFDKLSYFLPSFDHVIITGDFNINTLKDKNRHSIYLKSLLSAYNLHIINNEPTHHVIFADGSLRETCLDLCIVRHPSLVLEQSKSMVPFVAGHDLITLRYNVERTPPPPATRMVRSWRTVASHTLNNTILHQLNSVHLLPNSICGPSLDPAVSSLTAAILSAADDVAPLRPATFSTRHKPWVDSEAEWLQRCEVENLTPIPPSLLDTLSLS